MSETIAKKLNCADHPAGTRLLMRNYEWEHFWDHPCEVTVVEWSPSGRHVRLKYSSGTVAWENGVRYVAEILPQPSQPEGTQ